MNKTKNFLGFLLIAFACSFFAACGEEETEDNYMSSFSKMTLSASWVGNFSAKVETTHKDTALICPATKTSFIFYRLREFSTTGSGKQVDRYNWGPYTEVYRTFKWKIDKKDGNNTKGEIVYDNDGTTIQLDSIGINETRLSFKTDKVYAFERENNDNSVNWDLYSFSNTYTTADRPNWEKEYEYYRENNIILK